MKLKILYILLLAGFLSCKEEPPTQVDGKAAMEIHVFWNNSEDDSLKNYVPLSNAQMILSSEYGVQIKYCDENGVLHLSHIPSSTYQISAHGNHPDDNKIVIVGNIKNLEVNSGQTVIDTIYAKPVSSSGIAINEIYSAGPVNKVFFFFDQFIELYNSSDEIKYLDGMQIFRVTRNSEGVGPGGDEGDDGDIDGMTYCFKFPGKPGEKNHPFPSHSFIVLAQDAIDHRNSVSTSIDLSNADWEFYNQLSVTDFDNPNVPNLININPERTGEFQISLTSDIIIVADGRDSVWQDGVDIETILDGVEYQSSATKRQTLDDRIDRGWIKSVPKYSGKSLERREPGTDTNDGTLDWRIIPYPTPGYQYE